MIRAKEELDAVNRHLIDSSVSVEEDASAGWMEEYRHNAGSMTKKTEKLVNHAGSTRR